MIRGKNSNDIAKRKAGKCCPQIMINHRTHISAKTYRNRAINTERQVGEIGKRLGVKVV